MKLELRIEKVFFSACGKFHSFCSIYVGKFIWVFLTFDIMKNRIVLSIFVLGLFIVSLNTSCKKETPTNKDTTSVDTTKKATYLEQMFELYVLNSPVIITQAIDTGGNNITALYQDEIITLKKKTYYEGPLEILVGGVLYKGTWKSNNDYSTLDLSISGKPEFEFFLSPWRFTYKSLNILRLAPITKPLKKTLELQKK